VLQKKAYQKYFKDGEDDYQDIFGNVEDIKDS